MNFLLSIQMCSTCVMAPLPVSLHRMRLIQSENEIFDVLIATGTSVSTSFTAEKLTTVISTDFTFSVLDAVQLWQRPSRHERSNEPLLFILHNDQALSAQFELLQQKRAPHSLFTVYDGFTADENKYLNRLLGIQSYDLFIKVLDCLMMC